MSFLEQYDLANTPEFRKRVRMAILKVAVSVQNEDKAGLEVPLGVTYTPEELHMKRAALSFRVLTEPAQFEELFAYSVATDATVTAKDDDTRTEAVVREQWNAFAIDGK